MVNFNLPLCQEFRKSKCSAVEILGSSWDISYGIAVRSATTVATVLRAMGGIIAVVVCALFSG